MSWQEPPDPEELLLSVPWHVCVSQAMPLGKFHDDLEKVASLPCRLSTAASEVIPCDSDYPLVPQFLQNTSEGRPELKKTQERHQVITRFPWKSSPGITFYVSGSGKSPCKHPTGTVT